MVIFKFSKTSTSALASHVDTLRTMNYVIRRADLPVEYSQGFNPHMELVFSPPLALGVESLCEYVCVKTDYCQGLCEKLNRYAPQGLRFERAFNCDVNVASVINSALYRLEMRGIGNCIDEANAPQFSIAYTNGKGVEVVKDVSSRILESSRIDDDAAHVVLRLGNDNLRPDRLVRHFAEKYKLTGDYKIVKTCAFVDKIPADIYLEEHSK